MNANGSFREDELVSRKVKISGEWQTRTFPVVGARLRIFHENNDQLSIKTKIIKLEPDFVVIRAAAKTTKGRFNGTGTASTQRDARLADSLVELAETRAIARALRFSGVGCEYTSAEEVSHLANTEPEQEQTTGKENKTVFPVATQKDKEETKSGGNGNGKPGAPNGATVIGGSKPQSCGNGRATQAQCRALFALTKKARYAEVDINSMLAPLNASAFQDLSREDASRLISALQTEVAA
jgi:hypothetical protein